MVQPRAPAWATDLGHLDAIDEVAFGIDGKGRIMHANPSGLRAYPVLRDRGGNPAVQDLVISPEDRDGFGELLDQVLAGQTWRGPLRVLDASGRPRAAQLSCAPLCHGEEIVGALCIVDDRSVDLATRGRVDDRLTRLARVAAELGAASDRTTLTETLTRNAADAVGATVASLALLEDDWLVLSGLRGGRPGASDRWSAWSIDEDNPASEAARTGQAVLLTGREAIATRYPDLERAAEGERSMACLPLRLAGRTSGVFTLSFPGRRELDRTELEFLGVLADSAAQVLERIRAQEVAAERLERLRFLTDAAGEMASSLDYQATLVNVAHMVVPRFADWSAIDVMEDDRLHRLAVAHVDPAKMQLARDLEERYPADRDADEGAWGVVRSGQSVLFAEITDEMLVQGARDEEHLALARSLQLGSLMMVPLMVRDRLLGVMTWAMAESGRHYTEGDVEFGEDLAARAAVAMDNAQLHTQVRDAALQLQHAVLPDLPSDVPGWELAAHYQPSGRTEVGGDFYDVCPLEDGRMAVFVGDVMGRGVAAAAAMAQMRSALRAFIAIDPAPEVVLGKLDRYFGAFDLEQLVTVAYYIVDPERDELVLVNAGHLPPVVLGADGTAAALPIEGGPPLGLTDRERAVQRHRFGAGDAVLGYTDGLVERRDEDLDVGLRRLEAWVPGMFRTDPTRAMRLLAEELRDRSRDDDVAMVFVRRLPRK